MEPDANQSRVTVIEGGLTFQKEVAAQLGLGNVDLTYCFQCGVCSGSCPTGDRMDFGPRKIMQMIRLGMVDAVLRSPDIWYCVSCYSCTSRCPQGIKGANVMAALRNMSIARGLVKDKEAVFSQVFMDVVQRYGRMYEPELLVRYFAREADLAGLLRQAGVGLAMLRKRKIALRPERIENVEELGQICARIKSDGGKER